MALTDTLDDLISERRIEPQLAMKILANFDRSITEALADKVKARLTFKVLRIHRRGRRPNYRIEG
jgi:transcription initiation factor TFIIA small subunit